HVRLEERSLLPPAQSLIDEGIYARYCHLSAYVSSTAAQGLADQRCEHACAILLHREFRISSGAEHRHALTQDCLLIVDRRRLAKGTTMAAVEDYDDLASFGGVCEGQHVGHPDSLVVPCGVLSNKKAPEIVDGAMPRKEQ